MTLTAGTQVATLLTGMTWAADDRSASLMLVVRRTTGAIAVSAPMPSGCYATWVLTGSQTLTVTGYTATVYFYRGYGTPSAGNVTWDIGTTSNAVDLTITFILCAMVRIAGDSSAILHYDDASGNASIPVTPCNTTSGMGVGDNHGVSFSREFGLHGEGSGVFSLLCAVATGQSGEFSTWSVIPPGETYASSMTEWIVE